MSKTKEMLRIRWQLDLSVRETSRVSTSTGQRGSPVKCRGPYPPWRGRDRDAHQPESSERWSRASRSLLT